MISWYSHDISPWRQVRGRYHPPHATSGTKVRIHGRTRRQIVFIRQPVITAPQCCHVYECKIIPTGNRSSHDINLWFHQGVPRLSPHDSWDRPEPPDMDDVGWSLRPDRSTITRHYVVIVGTLSIRCSKSQDDGVTCKCSVVILFMLCFVSYFYFMVVRVV